MDVPYQIRTHDQYLEAYRAAAEDPEVFWADVARHFRWRRTWDSVLEWNFTDPQVRWFHGAKLNITENCLDRHLDARGGQPALIFEPNDPGSPSQILTYRELHFRVMQFAQVLKNNGVQKGDRVNDAQAAQRCLRPS